MTEESPEEGESPTLLITREIHCPPILFPHRKELFGGQFFPKPTLQGREGPPCSTKGQE